jgi:uncharacterized protein (DUF305 family)
MATALSAPVETEEPAVDGAVTVRRPERRTWVLVLLAVVTLAVGYAGGLLTPGLRAPGETSAEAGFARDMSRHHAQAVEMAMVAWAKASSEDIRKIGYDMALTQQNQIGQMQRWLQEWNLLPTGSEPAMAWMPGEPVPLTDGLMPGMATGEEIRALHDATGPEVDRLFLQMMIKHHLGGIHMADGLLEISDRSEVVALAQTMKTLQQKEITELTRLQRELS